MRIATPIYSISSTTSTIYWCPASPFLTPPSSKMGHILVNFSNTRYSAIRLCAPHVSLPDRSRCETADRA